MSDAAAREYVLRTRARYSGMKSRQARGRVLDEFCATTELSRKHAIKVLYGTRAPYCRSGRPRKYGREVTPVLKDRT